MTTPASKAQLEMQQILKECLECRSYDSLEQCLTVYEQTFGKDEFYIDVVNSYIKDEPLLSLICLGVDDDQINAFLSTQLYQNIEIVKMGNDDTYEDLCNYFSETSSEYICFLEPHQTFHPTALVQMIKFLSGNNVNMAVTARDHITSDGTLLSHPDRRYQDMLSDGVFSGKALLEFCLEKKVNLYGILSTLIVSTQYAKSIPWQLPECRYDEIMKVAMLSQFLLHGSLVYLSTPLVATEVYGYRDESQIQNAFYQYISSLNNQGLISVPEEALQEKVLPTYSNIAKHITFFYTDMGEYYNVKPIADEAQRRGYQTTFTTTLVQQAEIGVYCQHDCWPENSKFSLILLHDMTQAHNCWPNIWNKEHWDKFDIGILPGEEWVKRWRESACHYYANPRIGTYAFGYPKSDIATKPEIIERADELRKQFNLKYDFSVLYAPSWENDEKEDDFIRALASLPINLLIKHSHWSDHYAHIIENIRQMRVLHEGQYENLYYIEPEESIMVALELCDVVVSDESSVMTEAILYNKPSVAVYDWLIPDTVPSRFSSVPTDYLLKCKRVELREYIEKLSTHPEFYAYAQSLFVDVFSNQGLCCKNIMDSIDYYTQNQTDCAFEEHKLSSKYSFCSLWN